MRGRVLDVHTFETVTQTLVGDGERSLIIIMVGAFDRLWSSLVPVINRLGEEPLTPHSDAPRFRRILKNNGRAERRQVVGDPIRDAPGDIPHRAGLVVQFSKLRYLGRSPKSEN